MKAASRFVVVFLISCATALAVPGIGLATDVGGTGGPGTGHEHPIGASPLRASLVPAFKPCTPATSNASHDSSLPGRSCNPPVPASSIAAVGDTSTGLLRLIALEKSQCAPFDPTLCYPDVWLRVVVTDVHFGSPTGPEYAGSMKLVATLPDTTVPSTIGSAIQITDARNQLDAASGGPYDKSATTVRLPFPIPVSCEQGTCSAQTSMNQIVPGAAMAGRRAILEWGQLELLDSNGDVFEDQGVFVP